MGFSRRNTITRSDAVVIAVLAAVSAVVAMFAGCSPTGEPVPDAILCGAVAALVTWLGASAPWWALVAASGGALVASFGGAVVWSALAVVAVVAAAAVAYFGLSLAPVRAAVAAVVVQVAFRLDFSPFFLSSAIIAGALLLLLGVAGFLRRQRFVRRRVLWGAVGVSVFVVFAGAGLAVAAAANRDAASTGYVAMLDGLEYMQDGDVPAATGSLWTAAEELSEASGGLGGILTQPARMVPVLAQHRNAGAELLGRAADAAESAAMTLRAVDLEQLRIENGVIDLAALESLAAPLADLDATVAELRRSIADAESPWLVAPFRSRLDTAADRAEQVGRQATALSATADIGPQMLGADGTRRYFLAFVNSSEARGHSGLMGNWSELTLRNGRLQVTRSGRTAQLQRAITADPPVIIDAPSEFFVRYGPYGANRSGEGVHPDLWSNVTMPPDMPTVGNVMTQLYEVWSGYPIDGAFVFDPAGIAALLELTGSISVPELDQQLTARNVEQFLLVGQYEFEESEREDFLESITDAVVDQVLSSTLPAPQVLATTLADPALTGHISGFAVRPEEQQLFQLVGMDASMPRLFDNAWNGDGVAVVNDNASLNKIDSFLQRSIVYRATVDESDGSVDATLQVTFTNDAPSTGYADYVIGNRVGLPRGTNRTLLTLYSPHDIVEYRLDGRAVDLLTQREFGWNATPFFIDVPPGSSRVIEVVLAGEIAPGPYRLAYRPQPMPRPDRVSIEVTTTSGRRVASHDGPLVRRSVLTADGIEAWR
jgi:hypothetical protein